MSENLNEVNIFENGFLNEFKLAQPNLSVCQQNRTACIAAQANSGVAATAQTASNIADWGTARPIAAADLHGVLHRHKHLRRTGGEAIQQQPPQRDFSDADYFRAGGLSGQHAERAYVLAEHF